MIRATFTKYRNFAQSIVLLWSGTVFGAILAFAIQALAGRSLGPREYGVFSNSLALTILLAQFATFGLNTYWLNVYGKQGWGAQGTAKPSLHLLTITCLASTLFYATLTLAGADESKVEISQLFLLPSILGFAAVELMASKFQLEERYRSLSALQFGHHFARLILLAALLLTLPTSNKLSIVTASYGIVAIVLAIIATREISSMSGSKFTLRGHQDTPPQTPQVFSMTEVAKGSWLFGVDELLYIAYFHCSNILLRHLDSPESAGLYFAAFNIMAAIYLLPSVLYSKFLSSKIQRWAYQDKTKLLNSFRIGAIGMLSIGLVFTCLLVAYGDKLVHLLYGQKFANAGAVLFFLAPCAPVRLLSTSIGSILSTRDFIKSRVRIKLFSVVACVAINYLLIPTYGSIGAAIATLATELIILALFAIVTHQNFREIFLNDNNSTN